MRSLIRPLPFLILVLSIVGCDSAVTNSEPEAPWYQDVFGTYDLVERGGAAVVYPYFGWDAPLSSQSDPLFRVYWYVSEWVLLVEGSQIRETITYEGHITFDGVETDQPHIARANDVHTYTFAKPLGQMKENQLEMTGDWTLFLQNDGMLTQTEANGQMWEKR